VGGGKSNIGYLYSHTLSWAVNVALCRGDAIPHVFMVRNFEVMSDTLKDDGILLLKVT